MRTRQKARTHVNILHAWNTPRPSRLAEPFAPREVDRLAGRVPVSVPALLLRRIKAISNLNPPLPASGTGVRLPVPHSAPSPPAPAPSYASTVISTPQPAPGSPRATVLAPRLPQFPRRRGV
ncbi:hypothetical protein PR202_gb01476 [Eleusine coracana subsp. coracana]|uniref:Uncharacterized protein n=1 Tax=Eleusine coracana subsp. coracana TaxID=191504 RepID=A0AAV5DVR2_ELECO|nr:hypothetical protein PR202_gb01476 [Eleusine coracana subsp. coracana]